MIIYAKVNECNYIPPAYIGQICFFEWNVPSIPEANVFRLNFQDGHIFYGMYENLTIVGKEEWIIQKLEV